MDPHYQSNNGLVAAKLTGPELLFAGIPADMTKCIELRWGVGLAVPYGVPLQLMDPRSSPARDTFLGFAPGIAGSMNLPEYDPSPDISQLIGVGGIATAPDHAAYGHGVWVTDTSTSYQGSVFKQTLAGCHMRSEPIYFKVPAALVASRSGYAETDFPNWMSFGVAQKNLPSIVTSGISLKVISESVLRLSIWRDLTSTVSTDSASGQRAVIDARIKYCVLNKTGVEQRYVDLTIASPHTARSVLRSMRYMVFQWPLDETPVYVHNAYICAMHEP